MCYYVVRITILCLLYYRGLHRVEDRCRSIDWEYSEKCAHYLTELESGGNVKLTQCGSTHSGFKSCCELVQSRFSVQEMHCLPSSVIGSLELTGIKVVKTTRIENRLLYNR